LGYSENVGDAGNLRNAKLVHGPHSFRLVINLILAYSLD